MTQSIDKMLAILVALEMINDLSKSSTTKDDIQVARIYVHSLEGLIPFEIVIQLYELISHLETFQYKLNH